MKDEDEIKEQMLNELLQLRHRIAELEALEAGFKQVEEALRECDRGYRILFEQSRDAIFISSREGKFIDVNQSMLDLLGYTREEMLGMNVRKIYASLDDRNRFQQETETKESVIDYEMKLRKKDGTKVDCLTTSSVRYNDDGSILGYQGINRDITERKVLEEKLKESEKKYRELFQGSTDAIAQIDKEGRFLTANDAMVESLGVPLKELIGKTFFEVMPQDVAQRRLQMVIKALDKGQKQIFEDEREGKCFNNIVVPIKVPGQKDTVQVIARDITERKQAEVERNELEQRAQLASHLATVGEMASGIAHEVNNPLTGVIGFAQLLMQKDVSEDTKEYARIINDGAQRVANIVKRLLTFARQQKLERTYIDINQIIETTLQLRAYEMETNNIEVITHLDPDLPWTTADASQLQQVFLNIIMNAENEMGKAHGRGKLWIKTEAIDNTIRISFKDDGPGVARENLGRLFDPFFTTRSVGEGTGLGLSICHGIVTEHNGRLYVKSKPGKGATFIVELPIITEEKQLGLVESATDEFKKRVRARILVVDDEPATLQLLSQILAGEGYEVETVDNATDALERIKLGRYSLIVLDIKLPGMSGLELYKSIQEIAQSLARRVIFITGDVMGTDTKGFLYKTKAPYISKPFNIEQLKKDIHRILIERS